MKETQESVNLRREQLQKDLEKTMKQLETLQATLNRKEDEHVNVLFEKQKESAKETGKISSPENVKKVIDKFYAQDQLREDITLEERENLAKMCTRKNLMRDFDILEDLDQIVYGYDMSIILRRLIEALLDRAFDAGILGGVALYIKSMMENESAQVTDTKKKYGEDILEHDETL